MLEGLNRTVEVIRQEKSVQQPSCVFIRRPQYVHFCFKGIPQKMRSMKIKIRTMKIGKGRLCSRKIQRSTTYIKKEAAQ